jgi:tetratricopeptide (TPR) repeat protein/DNA-binding XRE family transcriptional regulator
VDPSASRTARRQRLAQRRKGLGLTQEDLADLLGVERSTVVRWERGETEPLPWTRPKLAKALRVSADRLEELLADGGPERPGDLSAPPTSVPARGGGQGAGPVPVVPQQLPTAVPDFTGRGDELGALTRILDESTRAGTPGTVVISAIGGTAGVGKTALALHWAHQVAHRFTDGQLHVNLGGFDPSGVAAAPAEAIRGFLDALGVPPERIPASADAQAGLYRSLLADKRMLILLDNARDEQQVRPLLPASQASLIVVTSRNQLTGLAAAHGAQLLTLDVLTHAEAVELLTVRLGHGRAAAEPAAIAEIATRCACLPLALAIAAARAAARPHFPLASLADELDDAAGRLDALDGGDAAASVRAVFSWSYQQLGVQAARMFRLLGLHPGPDISVPAAASLARTAEPEARRLLRELSRAHLIGERAPGRYALHDLLRAYAADEARDNDSEPERAAAVGRVLDHYLHTGHDGKALLLPPREQVTLPPPRTGTAPEQLADYQQAMAWFEAEHSVLLAAIALAAASGFDRHAWQLPRAIAEFLYRRGHYRDWVATQRTALDAAIRLGDTQGQAVSSRLLANACMAVGDLDQARCSLTASLQLYRQVDNAFGELRVLNSLCELAIRQGRYVDALGHAEQALSGYQAIGNIEVEADLLNNVGWCHGLLGDYHQARTFCRRSLTLAVEIGSRFAEHHAWDSLGYVEHQLGNFGEAAACYERALPICHDIGTRYNEAEVHNHLGDARHASGELPRAREAWRQALAILEDIQHPGADQVRAKLADLND